MRVIFTGHTGVCKSDVLRTLITEVAERDFHTENLKRTDVKKFIASYSVEKEIESILEGPITPFLEKFTQENRNTIWRAAFRKVLEKVNNDSPSHALLEFHNLFLRNGNFFSCVDWDLVMQFRPTIIITLIDDIYDVWQRVNDREKKLKTDSYFELSEILSWRTAEITAAETLAKNLFVNPETHSITPEILRELQSSQFRRLAQLLGKALPHFVFAVKHPISSLYQLLFRRDVLTLYTAFPITATRHDSKRVHEINSFRKVLHENFTVFDPVTIDELRFEKTKFDKGSLELTQRWDICTEWYTSIIQETSISENPFKNIAPRKLLTDIKAQLVARDIRLVCQSRCLCGYRPFYGAREYISSGMDAELRVANEEMKHVAVFHPKEDRTEKNSNILINFAEKARLFEEVSEVIDHLNKVQAKHKEIFNGEDRPLTWE